MNICILGLSITSSWGNGHATTFRALVKQLYLQGHEVTFFERDVPWYASQRDLPQPPYCKLVLYKDLEELTANYTPFIAQADLVMVGSYVPEGVAVARWVFSFASGIKAFYDIDTPVTLAKIEREDYEYLHPDDIALFDLYLSFTGGPILSLLMQKYGSPMAKPLYCSVDTELYFPTKTPKIYDLAYLGTYSIDRQAPLDKLLTAVMGPQYPEHITWPKNVIRKEHLAPSQHNLFYNQQRFTLNITRSDMVKWGYAPSVRLFEAAAAGTPIISDYWEGLDSFFALNDEILIAQNAQDTLSYLLDMSDSKRLDIAHRALQKVLKNHSSAVRAKELISYTQEAINKQSISN